MIESASSATEYETMTVQESSPVNADLAFDRSQTHVYAMTEKKVGFHFKCNFLKASAVHITVRWRSIEFLMAISYFIFSHLKKGNA